jgi:sulfite exporter TauE/SafE/copper chaperone CopZ
MAFSSVAVVSNSLRLKMRAVQTSSAQTFHISGMHCPACVTLVEGELTDLPGIASAKASLARHQVEIAGPMAGYSPAAIIAELTPILSKHGYAISAAKPTHKIAWRDFLFAVPVAALFLAGFWLLQGLGIVNLVSLKDTTYSTAFVIGVIASLSTCMAVVGGLTLSVSANFAMEGSKVGPQLMFHTGRLVAFFILGGLIGALGTQFDFTPNAMLILNLVVALAMLILGLNLLDVLPGATALQPTMPAFVSRHLLAFKTLNHSVTPALIGAATFFLPCGFTQSMQLYTLTSGSFAAGALTMGAFALGTLPVLGLLSFASLSLHSRAASGVFFKSAGLVVMAFALMNLLTALIVAGYVSPLPRF